MKTTLILLLTCTLSTLASAAMFIKVDTLAKEYYLSGSASGFPQDFMGEGGTIAWDNGLPYDGGYENFLSGEAFTVTGNPMSHFEMFFHGNGNVNGGMQLQGTGETFLQANPEVRYSYSGWTITLQQELEGKAASEESVAITNGASSAFALQFQTAAVPEPSTAALVGCAIGGFGFCRRRRSLPLQQGQ